MKTKLFSVIIIFIVMVSQLQSQPNNETLKEKILSGFEKQICGNKSFNTGLLLIHSQSLGIHWKTAAHHDSSVLVHPDQPFHFASIGKTVTSVIISILYEEGKIDFDDQISMYLDDSVLSGLHVYKGVDYSRELKIRYLLNHTSGLADYYTDKNKSGVNLLDRMVSEPDRFWTPMETISWTKAQLTPKFQPEFGFHYADTNYELLGLIIEKITGKPLHQCFHEYVFEPLEMEHTHQMFYSEPLTKCNYPMVDLYYKGVNLSKAKSISMSHAAGGIVSTLEDMLKFHRAIVEHKIIGKSTFEKMCNYAKMGPSVYYGYGIMNFRFMLMPEKYHIWGNSGSIGAFMYYNPAMDVYIIGSFHKMNYQIQPIIFIFNTLRRINKEIPKSGINDDEHVL